MKHEQNPKSFSVLLLALCFVIFLASPSAHAFKILSALTHGCHEKITLGALGQGTGAFLGNGSPSTAAMLARFVARVQAEGIPDDDSSRGLRRENARRYGWGSMSEAEIYIFSSFLAGVRAPDTGGYSIVDFSQIRGSHIRDDEQSAHFLRRRDADGMAGDVSAIEETKTRISGLATQVLTTWSSSNSTSRQERWTFAFYGEHDVTIFAPAYDLGLIAHAIQDSYAHAIRDESDLKILAVENYLDLVMDQYNSNRDGPGHSERLDQCNENDSFDAPRIEAARLQTARMFTALDSEMAANTQDLTAAQAILTDIFDYRSGCDESNQYCNSLWYKKAREEISEPYEIGCGLVAPHNHDHHHDGRGPRGPWGQLTASLSRNAMVLFLIAVLPILTALGLRRRLRV